MESERIAVPAPKAGGRPPKQAIDDGLTLLQVAELVTDGKSPTAAIQEITSEGSDGTNFRRLMRAWKNNSRNSMLVARGERPKKTNKWLEAVNKRRHQMFLEDAFEQARREISEGDLNVEEDPDNKAMRESKAAWFNFSEEINPDRDAAVQIAPLSRELYVKFAKKWILEHGDPSAHGKSQKTTKSRQDSKMTKPG